jgi:hypothetical protein
LGCRGKKKDLGMSRWKNELVLQKEEERYWIEARKNEFVLRREEERC